MDGCLPTGCVSTHTHTATRSIKLGVLGIGSPAHGMFLLTFLHVLSSIAKLHLHGWLCCRYEVNRLELMLSMGSFAAALGAMIAGGCVIAATSGTAMPGEVWFAGSASRMCSVWGLHLHPLVVLLSFLYQHHVSSCCWEQHSLYFHKTSKRSFLMPRLSLCPTTHFWHEHACMLLGATGTI